MAFRFVLGHHLTPLPCDDRGVWTSPDGEIEALLFPRLDPGEHLDPARHRVDEAIRAAGWGAADAYVSWSLEYHPLPLDAPYAVPRLCAAWGDWNLAGRMLRLARPLLTASVVDLPGVAELRRLGYRHVGAALMWGWDPTRRDVDVVFAGSRNAAVHAERERRLARVDGLRARHHVELASGLDPGAYTALLRRAKLVFNFSVRGEANMRAFEAAAQGACVLNERGNPSLAAAFGEDVGYAAYGDDLEAVVDRLLADPARRVALAREGRRRALEHTYEAHLADTLRTLRALCEQAPVVAPPAADDWLAFLLEQWRIALHLPRSSYAALLAAAPPLEAARQRALDVWQDTAAALTAAADASAGGTRRDAPFLLAVAEAALAERVDGGLAAAATVAVAPAGGSFLGVPTPDYGDWRIDLEQAVLAADDDAGAAAAADAWVRKRAAFLRAAVTAAAAPAEALALLDPEAGGPVPLVFLRGRLRCLVGRSAEGLADLERVADARPFAAEVTAAIAEARAARAAGLAAA